jgi:hypothetical protein
MKISRHSTRWLALLAITLAGVAAVPPAPPGFTTSTTTNVVVAPVPVPITLLFDYPTNAASSDLTFIIHQSADVSLAITNWPVAATVPASSFQSNGAWTAPVTTSNYTFKVTFNVLPAAYFWYATASNFWTEGYPSNVLTSPPPALAITNLMIRRGTN